MQRDIDVHADLLDRLFDRALQLPPAEREAFASRACPGDDELRTRLLRRLADAASTDGFLDRSPLRTVNPAALEPDPAPPGGGKIGPFRLDRRLGTGGMGDVWLAHREDGEFRQTVALKLMLAGSGTTAERFRVERQIVAALDHPGIARLLDGGITVDGRPWMAMEYVDGRDLLAWCEAHAADLTQRLGLFLQVCDAVTYAHSRLVVHRDLKPGNVLVTDDGRVKLLDFGIAKLLDAEPAADATRTAHFSVAYAAPEQLRGEPVTTATDVFALGVTLYQLLTGRLPWSSGAVLGDALPRLLGDAPLPASRATDGRVPARLLRNDLDAILAKALRPDPDGRYGDARALADDVRRFLAHEPVHARAGARAYVARRFLRRHWLPVAAIAGAFAALAAGLAGIAWQADRAAREQKRAAATRDFLLGVFEASDPRVASDRPRGQITARELLDASVARIDARFADDPETRIELLGAVADIYRELDEAERYEHLHRRHLELARQQYGDSHPVVLGALLDDAMTAKDRLDYAAAQRALDDLDPRLRDAGLDRSALRARWWLLRGQSLLADSTRGIEARDALSRAAALYAAVAPLDRGRVTALADLGTSHSIQLEYDEARRWTEAAIAASLELPDRDDSELSTMYGNLGLIEMNLGHFAEAERAYARSAEVTLRTYGDRHPKHWYPAAYRARAAHLGGDRSHAWQLFDALVAKVGDSTHHDAMIVREMYGGCLAAEGRAAESLAWLERATAGYRAAGAGQFYDFELPRVEAVLGDAYDRAGRVEDARRTLRSALDWRASHGAPDVQPTLAIRERWGRFLLDRGDLDAAREQFATVVAQDHGRRLAHTALAHAGLARVALARGSIDDAVAESAAAVDGFEHVVGFRDVRMGPAIWLVRSEALRRSGDLAGARDWATRARDASRRYDAPGAPSIAAAEAALRATAQR